MKWKFGDICYFVESNYRIKQAIVTSISGDFCVVRYDYGKGIRLRKSRLYRTQEEAKAAAHVPEPPRRGVNPYMYLH